MGRLGGQYGGVERDHVLVQAPAHTHVKCPLLSSPLPSGLTASIPSSLSEEKEDHIVFPSHLEESL